MRTLAILGAGGHGRVVADCAECEGWDRIALFDDRPSGPLPWPIAGTSADLLARANRFDGIVVGIGNNEVRLEWTRRLLGQGGRLVSVLHPAASVSRHARIGSGSVVFAGAVINIGAKIGQAVIINTGASVDHDCQLGDGVHISPGARLAGGVTVGESSWIGIGSAVREMIAIGARVQIGAGAVVVKPVPDHARMVGNPARPMARPTAC